MKSFWQRHFNEIVVIFTTILLIVIVSWQAKVSLDLLHKHHAQPVKYGVTFTSAQAEALGLDWRETYTALLDDLHIKRFRLVSYWNEIEPKRGEYNFSNLDYQLAEAKKRRAEVTLAIGLRQPRYPECHQPDWWNGLSHQQQDEAIINFVTQTVKRYRNDSTITSWQLENEAVNTVFGECPAYNRARLNAEFKLVKQLDPARPVVMSVSNEYGLPLGSPRPDQFSLSVYRIVYNPSPLHSYFTYPFTPLWHGLRAALIERLTGRPVFVGELQAEPWGPGWIGDMSLAEQNKSMDAAKLKEIVQYARGTGLNAFDLWGGEWWYWRLKHGDPTVWQAAKAVYKQ